MLSKEENDFIRYWEKNRTRRKKVFRQFLIGIPLGLLFVIPTVISLTSGWYKRAEMEANSPDFNPMVLFVALLLIVGFTAIFYQRWQWDQYEQRYRELLVRREPEDSGLAGGEPGLEGEDSRQEGEDSRLAGEADSRRAGEGGTDSRQAGNEKEEKN
jgi:hypothetical protein